ncbi:MAG TPA: hypothetical protein VE861_15165, partial [Gemmatimonadaceae bacterium]|nr:hypothetical protein [Gemmatimonadaceae bacterium]
LWAVQRMLFGPAPESMPAVTDLTRGEAGIMVCFVIAIIGLGLAPAPVQRRMESSIGNLVNRVNIAAVTSPVAISGTEAGR